MDQNEDLEESEEKTYVIPGYRDTNTYCQETLRSVLLATKSSNDLPSAGDDFDYYSTFEGFRTVMLHKGQSILTLMSSLSQKYGIHEKFQGRELEEKFDLLVDINDVILENVSNCLDEASGQKKSDEDLIMAVKPQSVINTSWNKKQFNSPTQSFKLLTAKNISRPQLAFKEKIDNSNSLFMPILKEKPNSIKPLAITLEKDGEKEEFCHPYEWEIEKFTVADEFLQEVQPAIPKPLEETPLVMVKTENQLKQLCTDLQKEKEFAVDLEHHAYRTFQGFSCLMQISTREKDYVIDVLDLRSEMHLLNEVFTDPKIVKVFHGADMDVLWLQRDFGLYIVNLFDTGQAARVLHFAHLSLSYLLKHYCKIDVDKQFQLADWRIRPLPQEMIKYARQDTHYLLYVYDCLKNDLLKSGNATKNLLRSTFERSKMICLKKYQKPLFNENSYIELYRKSKKALNTKQLFCLKELYLWRDNIARENDESLHYVLPNHMLLQIAEALPREQQGILACCNPIPPLVKQQLNEIHSIVLKANDSSAKQLAELEHQQKVHSHHESNHIDLNNLLHCPHDIIHVEEKKSLTSESFNSEISLPLITKDESSVPYLKKEPSLKALFEDSSKQVKKFKEKSKAAVDKVSETLSKLISPFQRYKITEEIHLNQAVTDPEIQIVDTSTNDVNSIEDTLLGDSSVEITIDDESANSSYQNTSVGDATPGTSYETLTSTPFRKKKNKKRKSQPDISLMYSTADTEVEVIIPPKKSKTPEVVELDDDNFTPYDYSKQDYSAFKGRNKSKGSFKPETQSNFKGPGKHHGRNRKHFKQASFGEAKQSQKKWPQNR